MYRHIRHRTLRVGCDWVFNSAFRLLLSQFCSLLILGHALIWTGIRPRFPPPPWAAFNNHVFAACPYSVVHFPAKHHIQVFFNSLTTLLCNNMLI